MERLRSPRENRKGEYEVHDVPSRVAARLKRQGWRPVGRTGVVGEGGPEMAAPSAPADAATFDLRGKWMGVRARVRDTLGMDRLPASKDEACRLLTEAGYEVVEG